MVKIDLVPHLHLGLKDPVFENLAGSGQGGGGAEIRAERGGAKGQGTIGRAI